MCPEDYVFQMSPESIKPVSWLHISELTSSVSLPVCFLFLRRLERIFAETILCSEDSPSNDKYASHFNVLFIHFLFINKYIVCVFELFDLVWVHIFLFPIRNLGLGFLEKKIQLEVYYFWLEIWLNRIYYFLLLPIWAFISLCWVWKYVGQGKTVHYRSW